MDLCEFEASLVYTERVPGQATKLQRIQRNPVLENKTKQSKRKRVSVFADLGSTLL